MKDFNHDLFLARLRFNSRSLEMKLLFREKKKEVITCLRRFKTRRNPGGMNNKKKQVHQKILKKPTPKKKTRDEFVK